MAITITAMETKFQYEIKEHEARTFVAIIVVAFL